MPKKDKYKVPGTIIKCEGGSYIAFYEHRTDVIANGENEIDVKKNLKKMYDAVMKFEAKEYEEKKRVVLPASFRAKKFTDKVDSI